MLCNMKKTAGSFLLLLSLSLLLFSGGCGSSLSASSESTMEEGPDIIQPKDGELAVHFIDVGQGDSILLTCGGQNMLIDAGTDSSGTRIQSYLQKQGISTLDYVIGTHPDSDHIGGLDVILYKFDCRTILLPDFEKDTRTYDDVIQTMKEKNYTITYPHYLDTYSLGTASFTIITREDIDYGDNSNNYSIGILLTHGGNRFLFLGDGEAEAEEVLLSSGLDISAHVYKVSHHGSRSSSTPELVEAVSPAYAVISCGEDNSYGHPHAQTLNTLRMHGVLVFRTDEQGTITALSDGEQITWNSAPANDWVPGEPEGGSAAYVLNTSSMKFHTLDCSSVRDMSSKNTEFTSMTREEIIEASYSPCGRCNP